MSPAAFLYSKSVHAKSKKSESVHYFCYHNRVFIAWQQQNMFSFEVNADSVQEMWDYICTEAWSILFIANELCITTNDGQPLMAVQLTQDINSWVYRTSYLGYDA